MEILAFSASMHVVIPLMQTIIGSGSKVSGAREKGLMLPCNQGCGRVDANTVYSDPREFEMNEGHEQQAPPRSFAARSFEKATDAVKGTFRRLTRKD